jgi:hypothetical protein
LAGELGGKLIIDEGGFPDWGAEILSICGVLVIEFVKHAQQTQNLAVGSILRDGA